VYLGKLCGSWQAVAVGDLHTISELRGSWQAVWQLTSCMPLVSSVAVGRLYTIGKLYTAGELYMAGELCDSRRAV
jgi:hypothetical protein